MKIGTSNRDLRVVFGGAIIAAGMSASALAQECTCTGDINNDAGVDGADLAVVLGTWGTVDSPGDLNSDGTVDGADLAIVLGNWGPCQAPVNDNCANALLIGPGNHPICNSLATTDGPFFGVGSCGPSAAHVYNDLWYEFAPFSDGTLTLSTCGSASFDTVIRVYGSTTPGVAPCPVPDEGDASIFVACNDDAPGCDGFTSTVTADVLAGHIYKIRVGSYVPTQTGAGTLKLTFSHAGDSCANPIYADNGQTEVIIYGNTSDNPVTPNSDICFSGLPMGGVEWISLIIPCDGTYTITTCDEATDFDTVLSVFHDEWTEGEDCWTSFAGCNDDAELPGCYLQSGFPRRSLVNVLGVSNFRTQRAFKIAVSGFNGATGNYGLKITRNCE